MLIKGEIMIFDGTSKDSVLMSLANVFMFNGIDFKLCIKKFYDTNSSRLDGICSYYNEFLDFINFDNDASLLFSYINIFHSTTVIDDFCTMKKFGVLNLRESLIKETSLKQYFEKHNILFDFNYGLKLINNGCIIKFDQFNADMDLEDDYWYNYYGEYLRHRLSFDYNINGFLFRENIYIDDSYMNLWNESEFMSNIGKFIENSDICNEWNKVSRPYILKCKVDIESCTFGDGLIWPTTERTSKEIIEIALYYLIQHEKNNFESAPIKYVMLKEEKFIDFSDVEYERIR